MYQFFFKYFSIVGLSSAFFFLNVKCDAQSKRSIDSLENMLHAKGGIEQIDVLYDLAFEYIDTNDFNRALDYITKAQRLSLKYEDSLKIVMSARIKGQILRRLDRTNEAINSYLEVLPVATRNASKSKFMHNEKKYLLNGLAIAYTFQANYDKALNYNFESLILREEEGDKREISISLNNIGLVYFKLKNFDKALEYYKRSLEFRTQLPDKEFKDRLLINIGLCYNELNQFKEAQKFINKGLVFCGDMCGDVVVMEAELGLGVSFFSLRKLDISKLHFLRSYKLARKINDKRYQIENLISLAKIQMEKNEFDSTKIYLEQAEKIATETEYNQLLIEIYKEFSYFYNYSRNFEKASMYQGKYIQLRDSIFGDELIKNLAKVQTNYDQRENTAIIATKEETIQRQRNLNIAVAIIALLCVLLVFVLYHSNKVKKRVNQALSDAKAFIELKNKELDKKVADKTLDLEVANQSLVKVNEELDNFIYKTSHDIRGPLASLKGICNVALLDVKDDVAVSYLHKLDLTAEHLNSILTRLLIINQINNSSMKSEAVDFKAIIDEIIRLELKKGMPLKIRVDKEIQEGIQYFSDREFVRIIFENLISNAVKFHNNSERAEPFIKIRVETCGEEIHIHVLDNGIGIREVRPDKLFQMFSRASERSSTGGIGLYITKTATEKLGGRVGLKVTPEGYTEFFIRFPVVPPRMA